MWEAIHSVSNFNVDVAIFGDFGWEIILLDKILGKVPELEAHVFISGHESVEVEIFDIDGHELGIGGGNDAVEK